MFSNDKHPQIGEEWLVQLFFTKQNNWLCSIMITMGLLTL